MLAAYICMQIMTDAVPDATRQVPPKSGLFSHRVHRPREHARGTLGTEAHSAVVEHARVDLGDHRDDVSRLPDLAVHHVVRQLVLVKRDELVEEMLDAVAHFE